MNGWFLAIIILFVLNLGINLTRHGEKKKENYNLWVAVIGGGVRILLTYIAIVTGF